MDEPGTSVRRWQKMVSAAISLFALAVLAAIVVTRLGDDHEEGPSVAAEGASLTAGPAAPPTVATPTGPTEPVQASDRPTTSRPRPTSTTTDASTHTTGARTTTTTLATPAISSTTATTAPRVTTTSPAGRTSARTTTVAPTPPTYAVLADGSPLPILAIFDVDRIELIGAVPDQPAVDRLTSLAVANSKTPATVDNRLTINPAVPHNVGVRVIELTSTRFPQSSYEILPDHARELDRVASILHALPHVTVLVVGHADQRGHELVNYALSEARASAVVNYLVGAGVAVSRLSSRAVGESDLLTLGEDAASLALNRRTEFVFYGLLVG